MTTALVNQKETIVDSVYVQELLLLLCRRQVKILTLFIHTFLCISSRSKLKKGFKVKYSSNLTPKNKYLVYSRIDKFYFKHFLLNIIPYKTVQDGFILVHFMHLNK